VAELEVRDDGYGFRVPARLSELTRSNHFGLVGMGEWVESAGGQLKIESTPGAGTRVYVRIPIDREDKNDAKDNSSIISR
jgi:signal transduction histidine kinase